MCLLTIRDAILRDQKQEAELYGSDFEEAGFPDFMDGLLDLCVC